MQFGELDLVFTSVAEAVVGQGAGGDEREMPRKFLEVTCEGWHSSKVERRESIPAGEPP